VVIPCKAVLISGSGYPLQPSLRYGFHSYPAALQQYIIGEPDLST